MPISKFGQSVANDMENAIQKTFPPVESVEPTFQIFVKDLKGKTVTINDVKASDTLQVVFDKAEDKTGVPSDEMRLNYAGKELVRTNTLADYNIQKEATLHQLLALKGGRLPSDLIKSPAEIVKNLPNLTKLFFMLYNEGRLNYLIPTIETNIQNDKRAGKCTSQNMADVFSTHEPAGWVSILTTVGTLAPDLLYSDPQKATAKIKGGDALRLKSIYDDVIIFFGNVASGNFDDSIKQVFGDGNLATAKKKYANAKVKLTALFDKIDTDYHGDDMEINTSGYAMFDTKIHLAKNFFTGDIKEAFVTLVHESMHLGNSDVLDFGYDNTAGYDIMQEDQKLVNADHFAEIARREKGVSNYAGKVFTPANLGGGGGGGYVPTIIDIAARNASEQLRMAWTVGLRLLGWFRDCHAKGDLTNWNDIQWVKFWSKTLGLTFHGRCNPGVPGVNTIELIDLALIEAVTRQLARAGYELPAVKVVDVLTVAVDEQTDPAKLTTRNIINVLTRINGLGNTLAADLKIVQTLVDYYGRERHIDTTMGNFLEEAHAANQHHLVIAQLDSAFIKAIIDGNNPKTLDILYNGLAKCNGKVFNTFCDVATPAQIKAFFDGQFPIYVFDNTLSSFIDAIFADSAKHQVAILKAIDATMLGYYAFSSADTYIALRGLGGIAGELTTGITQILGSSPNIATELITKCALNKVNTILHLTLATDSKLGIAMLNALDKPRFDEFILNNANSKTLLSGSNESPLNKAIYALLKKFGIKTTDNTYKTALGDYAWAGYKG